MQNLGEIEARKYDQDLKWDSYRKRAFIRMERDGTEIALNIPQWMTY